MNAPNVDFDLAWRGVAWRGVAWPGVARRAMLLHSWCDASKAG